MGASGQTIVRQVGGQVQQVAQIQQQKVGQVPQANSKINQKPIKDPNAPKKPLSAYFLFSQEERLKVKAENPDYSITEVAKELGKRWATLDPTIKNSYEQRYQDARKVYESEMNSYKPKKKKTPGFLYVKWQRNWVDDGQRWTLGLSRDTNREPRRKGKNMTMTWLTTGREI